jgi:hypothetical protein
MTPKGKLDEFTAHVAGVKALARQRGREIDVYTVGVITCRPTRREADEYYRHWVIDNADWAAVDHIMAMRGVTRERFPDDFEERRHHQANGMGGLPIVGIRTPHASWHRSRGWCEEDRAVVRKLPRRTAVLPRRNAATGTGGASRDGVCCHADGSDPASAVIAGEAQQSRGIAPTHAGIASLRAQ